MKAVEFVNRLEVLTPSIFEIDKKLNSSDYDEFQKDVTRRGFVISPNLMSGHERKSNDPIFNLILNYDIEYFEVGYFRFTQELELLNNKTIIGFNEIHPVVINKKSGAVEQIDAEELTTHYECARSSSVFLDALVIGNQLYRKRFLGECSKSDKKINEQFALRCAEVAGGPEYMDFYFDLFHPQS